MTKKILVLQENTKGRDFVVGDIHGEFELLEQALAAVNFDPEKDRVICVGDMVDRGPDSPGCLYYLAQPWFHAIRGNHEELFMRFYKDGKLDVENIEYNRKHGLGWILEQSIDTLDDIRAAFEQLPTVIEIQTKDGPVGFVHADVPLGMDWDTFKKNIENNDDFTRKVALWSRRRVTQNDEQGVKGVHRVFFGHTVVSDGPKILDNCFFIDTGAVFMSFDRANAIGDLFLSLIDIKATKEDIAKPVHTKNNLVRTVTVDTDKDPVIKPRATKPPNP